MATTQNVLDISRLIERGPYPLASTSPAASQPTLDDVIDANPIPCFVIDAQHRVTHWNKGCEHVLGIHCRDMLYTSRQWQAFYPSRRPTLADLIVDGELDGTAGALYGNKQLCPSEAIPGAFEALDFFPHLGDGGRWLHFTAAPIRDGRGRIIGAVETLQDITRQKLAEEALQRSHDDLERLVAERTADLAEANRKLAASLHKAEEVNRLKSSFLATVSHELKTPLNGIIGFAQLIGLDPSAAKTAEHARTIEEAGHRLFRIVSEMLKLNEIEAGAAEVNAQPASIRELVEVAVAPYFRKAGDKGLVCHVRFGQLDPEAVSIDGKRFGLILDKLLDNAVKFTQAGAIEVDVEARDHELVIAVSDTGPGIPEGAREIIFEKFQQLDDSAHRTLGGLGLGLALARAQAALLGGSLTLDPNTTQCRQGSRFLFAIPFGTRP